MTTDIQEWMVVQRYDVQEEGRCTPEVSGCDDNGPRSAPPASTSALQWRKIIYGEPLFPKRQSSASTTSHPRFPTHASRMAKIFNGEPIYPTLTRGSRASSPDFFSISSDSESDGETTAGDTVRPPPTPSRAPSPSAESVLYPLTTASAPAHPYLDPSFYNASAIPPVPPLPAEYASSARPASASGTRRPRELPRPPQHSTTHRSRSSPPRPIPIETNYSMPAGTQSASSSPDRRRPSVDTMLSRSGSMRVLPRPPPTPTEASSSHPPLRHSQSSSRPLNSRTRDKRSSQYNPRTLPQTPTAMSHPDWMTPTTPTHPDWMTGLQIRKRSHNEFYQWFPNANQPLSSNNAVDDQRPESIFEALDCPPPAYNSAEYAAGTSLSVSPHSPPTLPSLIRPSTAGPWLSSTEGLTCLCELQKPTMFFYSSKDLGMGLFGGKEYIMYHLFILVISSHISRHQHLSASLSYLFMIITHWMLTSLYHQSALTVPSFFGAVVLSPSISSVQCSYLTISFGLRAS